MYIYVLNDIVLVLAVTHELVLYYFYNFYAAPATLDNFQAYLYFIGHHLATKVL